MKQEVKLLKLADLVLWTENPRDPIRADAKDQDIVDKALSDTHGNWGLPKLARAMGGHYDFSELPTVVFHGKRPVVYDGNRRIVLGKIKLNLVNAQGIDPSGLPDFPQQIPCNVCSKEIALINVYRKHADSGSWRPLERDIFLHKHMNQPKSPFLVLEEQTGIISANPFMNRRFVKEEIFRDEVLAKIGLKIDGGKFQSKHANAETSTILSDITRKVRDKVINTRDNRGEVLEVLDSHTQEIVATNGLKKFKNAATDKPELEPKAAQIKTRRTLPKAAKIFGSPLYLKSGDVSNLYRDLVDLHAFYANNKTKLSQSFPSVIRMALRLLAETAAKDIGEDMADYVKSRFPHAKARLNQDHKTTLSNQNVTESSIVQLLQTGAHNYSAASNMEQSLAVSIVLGAILTNSHGKVPPK